MPKNFTQFLPIEITEFANGDWARDGNKCNAFEKTIILCKVAAARNKVAFRRMSKEDSPMRCRDIGNKLKKIKIQRWKSRVELVACDSAYQKVTSSPEVIELLKSTKNVIMGMAEDKLWGIGVPVAEHKRLSWPTEYDTNTTTMTSGRARTC